MAKHQNKPTWKIPAAQADNVLQMRSQVKETVRLSQCMIVKNEERNIEQALAWGKGIVCEQIVVDTGSTDRTVEIAERMGAKVFHFEWINDFSAAKNYAIEQATGNWIAFLDADEYFFQKDAQGIFAFMQDVQSKDAKSHIMAIRTIWTHLNDEGVPFTSGDQVRIFRNLPHLRYQNAIHETLPVASDDQIIIAPPEFVIFHTGYAARAYEETGKAMRNMELIRIQLQKDPDNMEMKGYLQESLYAMGENREAATLCHEVIHSNAKIHPERVYMAYHNLLRIMGELDWNLDERLSYCIRATEVFPLFADFWHFLAMAQIKAGLYREALASFARCEEALDGKDIQHGGHISSQPLSLYYPALRAAITVEDVQSIVRYATLTLKENKHALDVLVPLIKTFNMQGHHASAEEIFTFLLGLYDFNNVQDKVFLLRCARQAEHMELFQLIRSSFSPEDIIWLTPDMANTPK